jgi:hypothetical protein
MNPNTSSRLFRKIGKPMAENRGRRSAKVSTRIYFINLALIVLLGVLACGWLLYYSDWFEVVGGLLALGGAFTWLAFVLKVLREDRINELQAWIETYVLGRKKTLIVSSLLLLLVVLVPSLFVGTIQIDSFQEPIDRVVYVYKSDTPKGDPMPLPAGRKLRAVLWTSWWSRTRYIVKVNGYPDRVEELDPLCRRELRVPSSFRRPVLLVRPSAMLSDKIHNRPQTLVLTIEHSNGRDPSVRTMSLSYYGQALWIGCDDDVEVPQALQEAWVQELQAVQHLQLVNDWRRPDVLDPSPVKLEKGDQVKVELMDNTGKVWVGSQPGKFQGRGNLVIEEVLYEQQK